MAVKSFFMGTPLILVVGRAALPPPTRCDDRDCGVVADASKEAIVGNAVRGVPSGVSRRFGTVCGHAACASHPPERRGRRSLRKYRRKRKTPLSLITKRQRRKSSAVPLLFRKINFRHSLRCIGRTRRFLLGFRPLLGGDTRSGHITALHQTAALWNVGADGLVLVIALSIYLVGS